MAPEKTEDEPLETYAHATIDDWKKVDGRRASLYSQAALWPESVK